MDKVVHGGQTNSSECLLSTSVGEAFETGMERRGVGVGVAWGYCR